MIRRAIEKKLLQDAKDYPVVTVTGPRQSGKTTLVRQAFSQYDYVSMEEPDHRIFALEDPRGFLGQFSGKVILDEAQRTPDLFSYIQTIVDERAQQVQFVLTGSQNFLLLEKVSQSLAGRFSILHLLPFSMAELESRSSISQEQIGISVSRRRETGDKRQETRDCLMSCFAVSILEYTTGILTLRTGSGIIVRAILKGTSETS